MEFIKLYWDELILLLTEISPYLLFGFLFAGILKVYFPKTLLIKYMGKSNALSSLNASLLGVPMPLCSCGVIPTAIALHRSGASKGATNSFLISTPQTGIDSILVTYSMLGLPFAIIRPIVALVTGFLGGIITNLSFGPNQNKSEKIQDTETIEPRSIGYMLRFAYVEFLQDISKWLIIGLLLAALIAVAVPDNFFSETVKGDFTGMLLMLIVAVPMYVCATASVPIAAVLFMKGLAPGAVLVFLMAGPATNAATLMVLWRTIGKKSTMIYLSTIVLGAIIFGTLINFFPREWFIQQHLHGLHQHDDMIPAWIGISSSILLIILIINGYYQKYSNKNPIQMNPQDFKMNEITTIKVSGMTCNHCKANVENNLKKLPGIDNVVVDLANHSAQLTGKVDLEVIRKTVEELGYGFES